MKTSSIINNINTFFLKPSHFPELGLFRIGIAVFTFIQFSFLSNDLLDLYGQFGFIREEIRSALLFSFEPRLEWITTPLMATGMEEPTALLLVFNAFLIVLFMLSLGLLTKVWTFLAVFLHLCFMGSGQLFAYGADYIVQSCLFYCLIFPVGRTYSLDQFLFKFKSRSHWSNTLARRTMQIHLCIIYFVGGFAKTLGTQWWDGEAMWRISQQPRSNFFNWTWLANLPVLSMLMSWSILVLETLYPIFMRWQKSRPYWLFAIILMHLGIGIFMGLPFFSGVMMLFNLAAFGRAFQNKFAKQ